MREPLFEIIYGGINMFNIFGEALWLILDKVTDKVANYIKFKEMEKRIEIKD